MHTVGPGVYAQKTENQGKSVISTVGREICREIFKNVNNENYSQQNLEYVDKTENHGK